MLTKIPTFPTKENDIVQWVIVTPFLSFSSFARCMMGWHARDVRCKRQLFAFYIFRLWSSNTYIPIVIWWLDTFCFCTQMEDGIRVQKQFGQRQHRAHNASSAFGRTLCVKLIRNCCTWVNKNTASTRNYGAFIFYWHLYSTTPQAPPTPYIGWTLSRSHWIFCWNSAEFSLNSINWIVCRYCFLSIYSLVIKHYATFGHISPHF